MPWRGRAASRKRRRRSGAWPLLDSRDWEFLFRCLRPVESSKPPTQESPASPSRVRFRVSTPPERSARATAGRRADGHGDFRRRRARHRTAAAREAFRPPAATGGRAPFAVKIVGAIQARVPGTRDAGRLDASVTAAAARAPGVCGGLSTCFHDAGGAKNACSRPRVRARRGYARPESAAGTAALSVVRAGRGNGLGSNFKRMLFATVGVTGGALTFRINTHRVVMFARTQIIAIGDVAEFEMWEASVCYPRASC